MKKIILFSSLILISGLVAAQQIHRCYTHEVMLKREQNTAGYMQHVMQYYNGLKEQGGERSGVDTVYRIRVVFHVVHTTSAENIPDSLMINQIQVLNENYRRSMADTMRTREIFKPFAGDAGIEFMIATEDPDGNPTNGITRTLGTPGFLGFDPFSDNVKSTANGGKDPWPTDKYLNIWVCNVMNGFGILGYAYPPSDAPNWPAGTETDSSKQGVVIHFTQMGSNNPSPLIPEAAEGRTAVHEVGHYLGLRHIWGDGDCTEDDGLSDTPDADDQTAQSCDTLKNTCTEAGGTQFPDMIENYMDYSDERCQNMFTHQQIGIMRASLRGSRAGVVAEIVTGLYEKTYKVYNVSVYPNPASHLATIMLPVDEVVEDITLQSLSGRKIALNYTFENGKLQFNTTELGSGIYFVSVKSKTGLYNAKLVRN